jgi:transcriptional regulator with XRE-family HTH domain
MLRVQDMGMQAQTQAPRWIVHIEPKGEGIGARLKALRKAAGLSQMEVGRRLGWEQSLISRYEISTIPPLDFLERAEVLYGLDPRSLQDQAVREQLRRRGRPEPEMPGPAVALSEAWAEAVRLMVERYGSPEAAERALSEKHDNPGNSLPDHLAENILVGRQRIDEIVAEATEDARKCARPDTKVAKPQQSFS